MKDFLADLDEELDDHPTDGKKHATHKIVKGVFGYPGGKYKSLKYLLPHLPYRKVWVDVFGGSGIVTLNREPSVLDVYNDRWSGVVSFFRCIRDDDLLKQLVERLENMPNSKEEFYYCKNWNVRNDLERAVRWYYIMSFGFGAMIRNWGRATSTQMISLRLKLKNFPIVQKRMMQCQIDNEDWSDIFKSYDSFDTVFYCDPPYIGQHIGMYQDYFSEQNHVDLLDTVMQTDGFVAVSSYENELYDSYKWDEIHKWDVRSTIRAGKGTESNHRAGYHTYNDRRTEVLYVKF